MPNVKSLIIKNFGIINVLSPLNAIVLNKLSSPTSRGSVNLSVEVYDRGRKESNIKRIVKNV